MSVTRAGKRGGKGKKKKEKRGRQKKEKKGGYYNPKKEPEKIKEKEVNS